MNKLNLNVLFYGSIISFFILITFSNLFSQNTEYVCFPCGKDCDKIIHKEPGICSHCNMELIEKSRVKFKNFSPEKVAEILSYDNEVILLDVRSPEEFDGKDETGINSYGHLLNAINIPHKELLNRISEIERYKDSEIIVYCSHSHRSPYSCQKLTDLGFTNVNNMSEGLKSFVEKNLVNTKTGNSLLVK